jgi:hypothetical protein
MYEDSERSDFLPAVDFSYKLVPAGRYWPFLMITTENKKPNDA